MKRMLMMSLCPFLVIGMNSERPKNRSLEQALEKFQTIDPEAPEEEYRAILKQVKANGITFQKALARIMRTRADQNIAAVQEGWGLSRLEIEGIRQRVFVSLKSKTKKSQVAIESTGLLSQEVEGYIKELFEKKACKGILTVRNEPDGDSLIRLDNDVEASISPETATIKSYHYSGHTLIFNNQFLALDPSLQRAFIHFFTCKIAAGDALWSRLLTHVIKAKESCQAQTSASCSSLSNTYREQRVIYALCNTVLDNPEHAASLAQIYALYADQASRSNDFNALYPTCRDWAKRLLGFAKADQAIRKKKKN